MLTTLNALATQTPPPPEDIRPEVPRALSKLVMKLMAKEPNHRPSSAQAVVGILSTLEDSLGERDRALTSRGKRRSRLPVVLFFVLLAAILGVAAFFLAPVLVRIATPRGNLVIEADDPGVQVIVKKDGAVIVDKTAQREIELAVGDYEIEVADGKPGLKLSTQRFTLTRDGKVTVKVYLEQEIAGPAKGKNGREPADIPGKKAGPREPVDPTMEPIYEAIRIKNAQVVGGPFVVGDTVRITYQLVNHSGKEIPVPPKQRGPSKYHLGSVQHWIERLGADPAIPAFGPKIARRGKAYANTGALIPTEPVLGKSRSFGLERGVKTENFPPGRYRFTIEYRRLESQEAIQREDVEFELKEKKQ